MSNVTDRCAVRSLDVAAVFARFASSCSGNLTASQKTLSVLDQLSQQLRVYKAICHLSCAVHSMIFHTVTGCGSAARCASTTMGGLEIFTLGVGPCRAIRDRNVGRGSDSCVY